MILIWANFNAQSFIHLKLSTKCWELFFLCQYMFATAVGNDVQTKYCKECLCLDPSMAAGR